MPEEAVAKPDKYDEIVRDLVKLGLDLTPKAKKAWKTKTNCAQLRVDTVKTLRDAERFEEDYDRDATAWDAAAILDAGGDPAKVKDGWSKPHLDLEAYERDAKSASLALQMAGREFAEAIYTDPKLTDKMDALWAALVHGAELTDTTTLGELREHEAKSALGLPTLGTFGVAWAMWQGANQNEVKALRRKFREADEQPEFPTIARLRAEIRAIDIANSQPSPEEAAKTLRDRSADIASAALNAQARAGAEDGERDVAGTIKAAEKVARDEAELVSK